MKRIIAVFLLMLLLSGCGRSMPYNFPYSSDDDEKEPIELEDEIDWRYAYQLVLGSVPGLADYCMNEGLEIMDPGDEIVTVNDFECYPLRFCIYEEDDLVVVRRFAVSKIFPCIYEHQIDKDYWFEREVPFLDLSLYDARQILRGENAVSGFAFLGEADNWSQIARNTFSSFMYGLEDNKVSGYGSSEYLIIPADPDADVTVYLCSENPLKEVLYRSKNGDPIIITADSELNNVEVVVQGETGTVSFRPEPTITEIVNEEGTLIPSLLDILDIGIPFSSELLLEAALSSDPDLEGMSMMVDEGNVITLQYHPCQVVWFGTDHEDSFVREKMLAISDDYQWVFEYNAADDVWNQL